MNTVPALRAFSTAQVHAIVAVIVLFGMILHWWRPGYFAHTGDVVYPPDPWNQLLVSFSAWNHASTTLGTPSGGSGNAPYLLLASLLRFIAGESFDQILMTWLLMTAGWLATQAFLRQLGISALGASFGATFYVLNPWSIQFLQNPFQLIAIIPPVIGLLLLRFSPERARMLTLLLVLVAALLCAGLSVNPALVALLLVCIIPVFGLAYLMVADRRAFARWALMTVCLCILASAWWVVPLAWQYLDNLHTAVLSPDVWSWVVARSSLLNNMRWSPMWWWVPGYYPYSTTIDSSPFLYATAFVPIAALVAAMALATSPAMRQLARYSAVVVVIAVILSKGLHPPIAWFNEAIYKLPGMFLFREPTSKMPLIGTLFTAIGLALCVDAIAARLRARPVRAAVAISFLAALCVAAYPAFTGEVQHDATDVVSSAYAQVPRYWHSAVEYLNHRPDRSGVAFLPPDHFYQVTYTWVHGTDVIPTALLKRPSDRFISYGAYAISQARIDLNNRLENAIFSGSPLLGRMLGDIGFGYVLYRGDIDDTARNLISLRAVRAALSNASELRFGPLSIFAVPHRSRVEASHAWIAQPPAIDAGDELELRARAGSLPRLDRSAEQVLGPPASIERIDTHGLGEKARRNHAVVTHRIERLSTGGGRVCISVTYALHDLATDSRIYRLVNPSSAAVEGTLSILVLPSGDRLYTLDYENSQIERRVAASHSPVWLTFNRIVFPPGESPLVLRSDRASGGESLPPAITGRLIGDVLFSTRAVAQALPPGHGGRITFDPKRPLVSLGSLRLGVRLAQRPWVRLRVTTDPNTPVRFGVIWLVELRGAQYAVFQTTWNDPAPVEALDALEKTLPSAGVMFTASDFQSIRVVRAEVIASAWERQSKGLIEWSNFSAGWNEPARAFSAPRLTSIEKTSPTTLASMIEADGFVLVAVPPGKPGLLTLTDQYDPSWIGLAWHDGSPKLLPHLMVDRWRNGFATPGASTVLLFFLGVPIQLFCIGLTVGMVVFLALRLRARA